MEGLVKTVYLGCVSLVSYVRVSPVSNIRSLGVAINDTLSFNEHVDNVCKSCNFLIQVLRHIRRHILEYAAKTIACSRVNGQLDYCNSLLYRTSSSNINKLQWVQISVARIITRRRLSDHITPVIADLHWLYPPMAPGVRDARGPRHPGPRRPGPRCPGPRCPGSATPGIGSC